MPTQQINILKEKRNSELQLKFSDVSFTFQFVFILFFLSFFRLIPSF